MSVNVQETFDVMCGIPSHEHQRSKMNGIDRPIYDASSLSSISSQRSRPQSIHHALNSSSSPSLILILVGFAFICLIFCLHSLWHTMPSQARQACTFFGVGIVTLGAAFALYVSEHGGVRVILPPPIVHALSEMSVMDVAERIWSSGDLIDAFALLFLRLDRDHANQILSRMPNSLQRVLTTRGIVNLAPSVLRPYLRFLPSSSSSSSSSSEAISSIHTHTLQNHNEAESVTTTSSSASSSPRNIGILPMLLADIVDRRLRTIISHALVSMTRRGPLASFNSNTIRCLMIASCLSVVTHLYVSRHARRVTRMMLHVSTFSMSWLTMLHAMSVLRYKQQQQRQTHQYQDSTRFSVLSSCHKALPFVGGGLTLFLSLFVYSNRSRAATFLKKYRRVVRA